MSASLGDQRQHHAVVEYQPQPVVLQRVRRQRRAAADDGQQLQRQLRALFRSTPGLHARAIKQSDLCRSGGGGYFASGYYLKLTDYINPNAAFLYDFAPFVGAFLSPAQQQQLGTTYGIVSGPTNDGRGT